MRTAISDDHAYMKYLTVLAALVLFIGAGAAAQNPGYEGYVSLTLGQDSYEAGDTLEASITAGNQDSVPVVDGYLVVDVVKGCEQPTYPSQNSDCDNVIHEEKIEDLNIGAGESRQLDYTYDLPEDLSEGTYRLDVYFQTDRSPVSGIPYIFSAPSYRSFSVDGAGDHPQLKISRTQTRFTGTDEVQGSWDPNTTVFEETAWPSIAGPVGVLVTAEMDSVDGNIVVQNTGAETSAELELTVCEWDDTACNNTVYEDTQDVTVGSGNTTLDVSVDAPTDPGAYAVRMDLRVDGQPHSMYRNRLIVEGQSAKIRRMAVTRPYYASGDQLAVNLVTGTSPDHYTNPIMRDMDVSMTVQNLETGTTILDRTTELGRLSSTQLLDSRWFNTSVSEELYRYRLTAEVAGEGGQTYDRYSYIVDASEFAGDVDQVELGEYSLNDGSMQAEICGRTTSGVPAEFEAELMLMDNASLVSEATVTVNGCNSVTMDGVEEGSYELLVNADQQYRFDVDLTQDEPGETDPTDEQPDDTDTGRSDILYAGIVVVVLAIAGILYWRGRR